MTDSELYSVQHPDLFAEQVPVYRSIAVVLYGEVYPVLEPDRFPVHEVTLWRGTY
jgi:hypothetical protein